MPHLRRSGDGYLRDHIVIGGGLIGLTTAFELLRRGHDVLLIEAGDGVGLGTSFANGGLLTPSMADPWNAPGVHRNLLRYILRSDSALKLRLSAIPSLATWGPRFLVNSSPARHARATLANLDLARDSLEIVRAMQQEYRLDFDFSAVGTLKLFRSAKAMEGATAIVDILAKEGFESRALDAAAATEAEPCLEPIRDAIAGAIHYTQDATGDAYLFCKALAVLFEKLGGTICSRAPVQSVVRSGGRITGVRLRDEFLAARNVTIATGVSGPELASSFGVKLHVKPVKGYSITYQLSETANERPRLAIVDDELHAAVTPLGSRLRVAGTAEFARFDRRLDQKRVDNLTQLVSAIFPGVMTETVRETAQPWAGLRPVSADGIPYIGAGPVKGLWINCGHGHLGWTLACGSARLLSDLIEGKKSAVDPLPYAVGR